MKRINIALFGLPIALLLLVIFPTGAVYAKDLRSTNNNIDNELHKHASVWKKFLAWPSNALKDNNEPTAHPLYSKRKLIDRQNINKDDPSVLFSFKLRGSALDRYQKMQRYLNAEEIEETEPEIIRKRGPDPPAPIHLSAHNMVVHVRYEDIYAILLFLVLATAFGITSSKLGMPTLVGEIFAGFLFGPPLANFVPFPEALVLVGEIGLIMLLLEAGVELDVAQLKETGLRAFAIGCTGTMLPLLVGLGLGMASGNDVGIKTALAVGASFCPTSLGVAASALKAGKMLDSPVGQLVVASCVVDDILALIILAMFEVLVMDSPPIINYFIPIISSVGFLIVLGGSAVTWLPVYIEDKILANVPKSLRELTMFSIMTVMLLGYMPLLFYTKASYLTGAFLAGVPFSQIESAHHAFMEKTHQLMTWLLRVFFAASIGFQVPVRQFGDPYVIAWGFILYLCVAAKLPLAFYVPQFEDVKTATYNPTKRDRVICALSMTCRGEFSFIIAAFALSRGLFTAQIYAAIVWAVLLSCITSPFMLLNWIKYYNKKHLQYLAETNPIKLAKGAEGTMPSFLHIQLQTKAFGGMQEKFRKIANELGLEIVQRRTNRDGRGLHARVITDLYVRDKTMMVKLHKIAAQRKIKRAATEALGDDVKGSTEDATFDRKQAFISVSSRSLRSMRRLSSLSDVNQNLIKQAAQEGDAIAKRREEVRNAIEEATKLLDDEDAKVTVNTWNPWPWTEVLNKILEHFGAAEDIDVETFLAIFDKIDTDGGGEINQDEMYEALVDAGLDITEEGVITLVAMIDTDGNGDIDRDEWKETCEFYLELKNEEEEMRLKATKEARLASVQAKYNSLLNPVKTARKIDVALSNLKEAGKPIAVISEEGVGNEESENTKEDSNKADAQ